MITYKQFVERKIPKKIPVHKHQMKEVEIPDKMNLKEPHGNVWQYRHRYFVDTDHARNDRRNYRGVQDLSDKELLTILKRSADYMYDRGDTFLKKLNGNYMFYSKSLKQGVIIKVEPHPHWKERSETGKYDFTIITWLTHENDEKPGEADKRIYVENVSKELVKYLNDVILESNENGLIVEGCMILFENIFEIE